MPYEIEKKDSFFEVRVSGETSKFEVLAIIRELERRDPVKKFPDLWLVAGESQLSFHDFGEIARAIGRILPRGADGSKTAIVAADAFQKAQLEMYPPEASSHLPFEIRVFSCRDEAVGWIKSP